MPSPIAQHGITLDNTFDPYVAGTTKAAATGIYENGVDICNLYADISYGTAAAATGIRCRAALTDLNAIFAKKGTAQYALPINGADYLANANRGTATLAFSMLSDGTYTVVSNAATVATGSWLPSGGSVGDYTVLFAATGFTNGTDPNGGTDTFSNGAATQSALTTTRVFTVTARATTVGTTAANAGNLTIKLYRVGVLVSSTEVSLTCEASGN